jgi:hypothetical protein
LVSFLFPPVGIAPRNFILTPPASSPGQFLDFPDLDSNGQFGLSDSHALGYAHEDYGVRPEGIAIPEVPGSKPYPSRVLGQPEHLNHGHNVNPVTASLPSAVPISRSSELAFALQTQSEKVIEIFLSIL